MSSSATSVAAGKIVELQKGIVAAYAFVIELAFLDGRSKLGDYDVISLITY